MKTFLYKLAMLVMFILALVSGWCALNMVFSATLWNFLLGALAAFFLFRALELADRVNKYGAYSEENNQQSSDRQGPRTEDDLTKAGGEELKT